MYDDGIMQKLRSSGGNLKGLNKAVSMARNESSQSPDTRNNSVTHKKSKSQTTIKGIKRMDNRQKQVTKEGSTHEQELNNWKKNLQIMNKKNAISNHKRHLTDPKVSVVSIPKSLYNTYQSKKRKNSNNRLNSNRKSSVHNEEPQLMRMNKSKEKAELGL